MAGVVIPIALELTGVIAPSFAFRSGELVILPVMTDLPAAHTLVALTVAGVALVMVPSYVMGRMYDDRYEVKQRLVTYLWHLRQLLPPEARRPEGRQ